MNLNHILKKVGRRSSKPVLESADKMFTKAKRFAAYNLKEKNYFRNWITLRNRRAICSLRKNPFSKQDYFEK
jgi:hypothetical protein